MDFWASVLVVVRRWYVVLPLALLSLLGTGAVYVSVPTTYISESTVLMTAPPTGAVQYANGFRPDAVNPLLLNSYGLTIAASMLVQRMRTAEFAASIGLDEYPGINFVVHNGSDNPEMLLNSPFLIVTAESPSASAAQRIVERAVAAARRELDRNQTELGAPAGTFVQFAEVTPPPTPQARRSDRLRAAAAALALGGILTLASAFMAESLAAALHRRRMGLPPTPPVLSSPSAARSDMRGRVYGEGVGSGSTHGGGSRVGAAGG